jgi:hypothetical protein
VQNPSRAPSAVLQQWIHLLIDWLSHWFIYEWPFMSLFDDLLLSWFSNHHLSYNTFPFPFFNGPEMGSLMFSFPLITIYNFIWSNSLNFLNRKYINHGLSVILFYFYIYPHNWV